MRPRSALVPLTTTVLAAALLAGAGAAQPQKTGKDELAKKDLALLQGTWELVSAERDGGVKLPPEVVQMIKLVFEGNTLVVHLGTNQKKATITLDPTKNPKEIDMLSDGVNSPGLYQVDKDMLKLMIDAKDKTRAKEFATHKDDTQMLLVLKRKKD